MTFFEPNRFAVIFVAIQIIAAPFSLASLSLPVASLEKTESLQHYSDSKTLTLRIKRYARPMAPPILMIHGLAENDRLWDALPSDQSMALFFYQQGYDVWVGNLRSSGTPGFRSASPEGLARRWTVEDYAVHDIPALVRKVAQSTRQKPWIFVHSMAAWAIEGSLAGLRFSPSGHLTTDALRGSSFQNAIQGIVSIAGVYNLWWTHSLKNAISHPIRTREEFYQSNYELELFARAKLLQPTFKKLNVIPFGWIRKGAALPIHETPWIGPKLEPLYSSLTETLAESPLFNMFTYAPNSLPETVTAHAKDGIEDMGTALLEQVTRTILQRKTLSHPGLTEKRSYHYSQIRPQVQMPLLFVAGNKDRLAHSKMIQEDGHSSYRQAQRRWIEVEAGHLDVISGIKAKSSVWEPVLAWIKLYTPK